MYSFTEYISRSIAFFSHSRQFTPSLKYSQSRLLNKYKGSLVSVIAVTILKLAKLHWVRLIENLLSVLIQSYKRVIFYT